MTDHLIFGLIIQGNFGILQKVKAFSWEAVINPRAFVTIFNEVELINIST
jgi:hypothetical protein